MASPYKIPGIEGLEAEAVDFYRLLTEEKNDLACVLLSLAFLDLCLASLLNKFLIDGETSKKLLRYYGVLGPFHTRTEMTYCLGLISKETLSNLQTLGEMRNSFAHTHLSLSFKDDEVKTYCAKLTLPKVTGVSVNCDTGESRRSDEWPPHLIATPRDRFVLIVSLIASSLMGAVFTTEKRPARGEAVLQNAIINEKPSSEW
jgi:hypothetical protein